MPFAKYFYGPTLRTWIMLDDTGQTMRFTADDTTLGGWKLADARGDVTIDHDGASYSLAGKLSLPDLGSVVIQGMADTSGAFRLAATEDLKLHDWTVQRASIALSRDGVAISGAAQVRGPQLQIDAAVATRRDPSTDGPAEAVSPAQFALAGAGVIRLHDQKLAEGRMVATPGKLRVAGGLKFAGARFALAGDVSARGFDLTSSVKVSASRKIDFGVKKVKVGADGKAKLHLSDSGFSVKFDGDLDPGGHEVQAPVVLPEHIGGVTEQLMVAVDLARGDLYRRQAPVVSARLPPPTSVTSGLLPCQGPPSAARFRTASAAHRRGLVCLVPPAVGLDTRLAAGDHQGLWID